MSLNEILARVESSRMVTADDALAARRAVYGEGERITPAEIDALFRVDEAAQEHREVALRREQWLDSPDAGISGFFSRMASNGLRGVLEAYMSPEADWASHNAIKNSAMRAAEVVTEDEAAWLADRNRPRWCAQRRGKEAVAVHRR